MARKSTRGMRRGRDRQGRTYWVEIKTGKRTAPGLPPSKPQRRDRGGVFLTKGGKRRVVGKDAETGKVVRAARLQRERGAGGKFRKHETTVAAELLRSRKIDIAAFRDLAAKYGLTERQLWAKYDAL